MAIETGILTLGAATITKGLALRTRPFVYDEHSFEDRKTRDARFSFFSGHASFTAAMTFFGASIYSYALAKSTLIQITYSLTKILVILWPLLWFFLF